MAMYNSVPVQVRTGTHSTVKLKLKKWVAENVPLDWGWTSTDQLNWSLFIDIIFGLSIILSTAVIKVIINLYAVENKTN